MNITRCPFRIGLAGGSTDLESFIQSHGYGSVINFPINLYTYTITHKDVLGRNADGNYVVNYSKREECKIVDIKNDVVREVLLHFEKEPCMITLMSDVSSSGSGLAASSSYMVSLVKTISQSLGQELSNYECCKLALKLERKFNPLTGYQDPYGCGLGGLKRLHFTEGELPEVQELDSSILKYFDVSLVHTGMVRSSTDILKTVTPSQNLLNIVDAMEQAIVTKNDNDFCRLINEGWEEKQKTSRMICNGDINTIDYMLSKTKGVVAKRLCGAGGGGFFLVFSELGAYKYVKEKFPSGYKVKLNEDGVKIG